MYKWRMFLGVCMRVLNGCTFLTTLCLVLLLLALGEVLLGAPMLLGLASHASVLHRLTACLLAFFAVPSAASEAQPLPCYHDINMVHGAPVLSHLNARLLSFLPRPRRGHACPAARPWKQCGARRVGGGCPHCACVHAAPPHREFRVFLCDVLDEAGAAWSMVSTADAPRKLVNAVKE